MDPLKQELLAILAPWGQEDLLRFWDELDSRQRQSLAAEIRSIDFAQVAALFRRSAREAGFRELAERAGPPPSFRLGVAGAERSVVGVAGAEHTGVEVAGAEHSEAPESRGIAPLCPSHPTLHPGHPGHPTGPPSPSVDGRIAPEEARQRGTEALHAGHVGLILVAGGQGTRLGFDHPKGMFPIGPVSGKSLFEIHFQKVVALSRRYGVRVPLYLMTSPETHDESLAFLESHDRFGLPADELFVFCQGTMPAVDARTGKVLLARPDHVALSPDGHGGKLAAFDRSGAMADARARGIRHLFYFQVDNPLVHVADPEFLGYHLLSGSELTSQVVRKEDPLEKVGNVVAADGRLHVIEYSDLPDDVARRRAPDGSLWIWAGSIAVHAMELSFLERMARAAEGLPFHVARKKVPYVDRDGRRIEPAEPNAVKFERFIFDLIPRAERAIVVEVDAAEHFAPVKNAPGTARDSPEAAQARIAAAHRAWLRRAGVEVAEGVAVEISPLFALDPEELAAKRDLPSRVTEPTYFG